MTEPMTCPHCDGSGKRGMFVCDICNGRGTVKDEATYQRRMQREREYRQAAMAYAAEDEADDEEEED